MRTASLATTALLLIPASLRAEEFQAGVRSGIAWSSNVFGVPEDEVVNGKEEDPVSDFSARVAPFFTVSDPDGNLTWTLRYQPTYEGYLNESDLDGFDQDAAGSVTWRFADRWTFTLNESYGIYQNSIRFNEVVGPGEEVTLGFRNQEIRANRTGATLRHALTKRDNLSLNVRYNSFQFPDGGGVDRSVPAASLSYQHFLSERTSLGTSFSWTQQVFDRGAGGDDTTQFYNLAATLDHRFSRSFRLEASAGPTFVDSDPVSEFEPAQFALLNVSVPGGIASFAVDADGCNFDGVPGRAGIRNFEGCAGNLPQLSASDAQVVRQLSAVVPTLDEQGLPIDSSDAGGTDLTYFAHLALVKDWENWNARVSYDRSNSENARFGSSSVADTLSTSVSWRPRRFWTFSLAAAISLQEQSVDQVIPIAFQLENVPAPVGVTSVTELAQVQSIVASTDSNAEEYRTQSLSFNVNRQLTARSSAFASVYWYEGRQDGGLSGDADTWNNLVLWVGFDWKFDPVRF